MTNVSRALMEDRPEGFLQRQSSALARRDAKMEEERRAKEAEEAAKDAAAMRSTPEITKNASAMRRTVDDLRAWHDRKNASVMELRRRRDEYEDRVHNTFAPRMSKGSVAIDRERRNAAAKYRSARSATSSPGAEPSPSRSNDELHREHEHERSFDDETSAGAAGVDAFSPEPRVRNLRTAPTPTPMTRRASSTDGGGADAMAAVLAGAAMAGAAALAARTTGRGAAKPEAVAAGAKPAGGEAATGTTVHSQLPFVRGNVHSQLRPRPEGGRRALHQEPRGGHPGRDDIGRREVLHVRAADHGEGGVAASIRRFRRSNAQSGGGGCEREGVRVAGWNETSRSPRRGRGARSSGVDSNRGWTRGDGNRNLRIGTEDLRETRLSGGPRARRRSSPSGPPARAGGRRASSRRSRDVNRRARDPRRNPRARRGRSRATKRINRRVSDAAATEGEGEYWTAAGEDSAGEFGDLGTDPDAFVATARRGRETDAAWGHALRDVKIFGVHDLFHRE